MAIFLVSRHPAALAFARSELERLGLATPATRFIELSHASPDDLRAMEGCVVCGVLPLVHVARLCQAGSTVYVIGLPDVPPEMRGHELTAEQMREYGAHLAKVTATYEVVS